MIVYITHNNQMPASNICFATSVMNGCCLHLIIDWHIFQYTHSFPPVIGKKNKNTGFSRKKKDDKKHGVEV